MKLDYNRAASIVGIGIVPWTRLGPERWFDSYKIASLYDWDLKPAADMPEVHALSSEPQQLPALRRLNSQNLLDSAAFQQMLIHRMPQHAVLTYRTVKPPLALRHAGFRFLGTDENISARLENKARFRTDFANMRLPFPAYRIIRRAEIEPTAATLKKFLTGHNAVMLQDEQLSGGKGSFMVRDLASLQHALTTLANATGAGTHVVVSDVVENARERSVQCVVTRYGVFVGPLQKQIIGHPLLCNLDTPEGDRFCGGEVSPDDSLQAVYPEVKGYALKIGQRLGELGYKGVFSLDCLVDTAGKVFVLEINPRLTGMTPLLTMRYREGQDIPFYLLHILEAMNLDYRITDQSIDPVPQTGGLLLLHARDNFHGVVAAAPASGMYSIADMRLTDGWRHLSTPPHADQLLVQQYMRVGSRIMKPGGRVLAAFTARKILGDKDELLPDIMHAVDTLSDQVQLKKEEV